MSYPSIQGLMLVVICLALSACVTVGQPSQAQPQSYYLLTATASIEDPVTERSLGIGPIRVAPFLARPTIVLHNVAGEISLIDQHRWAEPLEQGIQRVMLQNLEAGTGAKVRSFPWTRATAPDLALRLDILDLNRRPDGIAVLEVNWVLEDLRDGHLIHSRRDGFMLTPSTELSEYPALVGAYSELLAQLARKVAEYLPE